MFGYLKQFVVFSNFMYFAMSHLTTFSNAHGQHVMGITILLNDIKQQINIHIHIISLNCNVDFTLCNHILISNIFNCFINVNYTNVTSKNNILK